MIVILNLFGMKVTFFFSFNSYLKNYYVLLYVGGGGGGGGGEARGGDW